MTPSQKAALDQFYAGATAQDASMIRHLLTDDFTFKAPMMSFDEPDAYVAHLVGFCGYAKGSRYIAQGDNVVHIFTLVAMMPDGEKEMDMCDVFTFRGDKIVRQELYTDSRQFPEEEAA
ncbi:nuclear transport factor 2 family protein [uncultured Litoreibacter sp.]|uniref:nuclear transport factor 2 family protein n=1 Tax=uncultured Litoreibacter sp. TaxID=1392394 RepID=UPI002637FCB4|nr:nuclear transport factor 2 family protein [uncultured Litoreibacter sp.]